MGKPSDVGMKVIGWGSGQTGHSFSVEKYANAGYGGRSTVWAIGADGNPRLGANEVVGAHIVVIEATDSAPPAGTPPCVVLKKRA
jgi:hypothetical protein